MRCNDVQVLSSTLLDDNIYQLTLPFPHTARAGQFVMIRKHGSANSFSSSRWRL